MATGNWKDILRAQHEELGRLEQMNAALNDDPATSEIDRFLKKKPTLSLSIGTKKSASRNVYDHTDEVDSFQPPPYNDDDASHPMESSRFGVVNDGRGAISSVSTPRRPKSSGSVDTSKPVTTAVEQLAPDTQVRYHQARTKMLTKQLEEATEFRKKLLEQFSGLEKQLKAEREESKKLKKRIQVLELEGRNASTKKAGESVSTESAGALAQEVSALRKDLQTAERLAKQADVNLKSKDTQLKRAIEALNKLKSQVTELQQAQAAVPGGGQQGGDATGDRLQAAEARVKVLERQRGDLINAFRKQMKLIDILKRQKVHIEAARMLAFTEDEFMKCLDWNA